MEDHYEWKFQRSRNIHLMILLHEHVRCYLANLDAIWGTSAKDFWDRTLVHGALVGDLHSGWWKLVKTYLTTNKWGYVFFCLWCYLIRFDTVPYTYVYFDLECFLHILLHLHKCWILMRLMYQWLYLFGVWGRTTNLHHLHSLKLTVRTWIYIGRACPKRKLVSIPFPSFFRR